MNVSFSYPILNMYMILTFILTICAKCIKASIVILINLIHITVDVIIRIIEYNSILYNCLIGGKLEDNFVVYKHE